MHHSLTCSHKTRTTTIIIYSVGLKSYFSLIFLHIPNISPLFLVTQPANGSNEQWGGATSVNIFCLFINLILLMILNNLP